MGALLVLFDADQQGPLLPLGPRLRLGRGLRRKRRPEGQPGRDG